MGNEESIKIAIVGLGHAATHQWEALRTLSRFEITAVCDIARAKQRIVHDDVPCFADLRAFVKYALADVVMVAVPTQAHFDVAACLLEAGFGVLLEKPATRTFAEFDQLISAAESRCLFLGVAFHARFGAEVTWFSKHLAGIMEAKYGRIKEFRCAFNDPYMSPSGIKDIALGLCDPWLDSGVNALSVIATVITPELLRLSSPIVTPPPTDAEVRAVAQFDFHRKGATDGRGSVVVCWTFDDVGKSTELYFEGGNVCIVLDHSNESVFLKRASGSTRLLADLRNGRPRLTNHYVGVFSDLANMLTCRRSNLDFAQYIHRLALA